jgi:hypothetical protein
MKNISCHVGTPSVPVLYIGRLCTLLYVLFIYVTIVIVYKLSNLPRTGIMSSVLGGTGC